MTLNANIHRNELSRVGREGSEGITKNETGEKKKYITFVGK